MATSNSHASRKSEFAVRVGIDLLQDPVHGSGSAYQRDRGRCSTAPGYAPGASRFRPPLGIGPCDATRSEDTRWVQPHDRVVRGDR